MFWEDSEPSEWWRDVAQRCGSSSDSYPDMALSSFTTGLVLPKLLPSDCSGRLVCI